MIALGLAHGHRPVGMDHPSGEILKILSAGVAEQVLTAAVVIALSAARRPTWEIYAIPVLMRVSYHTYYQTAGLSVIATGLIYIWLYRRTRRLTPIILAYITADTLS
jgi:membrane protease YdiL (CAAX protease family)